ncbi:DUF4097 family beta strand repeat-containing protein [Natrialba taiwanensis]|uniref:DUF4097 domain-containing protein n=1 Tax=Natrialba taiwanensis DSM 12281 TaxID=1230458 RepID=M0A8U5_9EURY|nr:DUF4097 family beta strand repeat-containing protein [Natrialba taiwanensis]ELY94791.1 hypothetical protein C484_05562 [Natrialba taiwanensis DSM 12281]
MDTEITRRRAVIATAAVSAGGVALGGIAATRVLEDRDDETASETFTATYDVDEVSIATVTGPISITGSERETVELEVEQYGAERALDRTTLSADEHNGTLDVSVDYDQTLVEQFGLTADSRPDSEIVCTVPHEIERAVLETRNGAIDVRNIESIVSASTANGEITLEDVSTIDSLSSTNGAINATSARLSDGALIETTNGDITIDADALGGDATFESTNGAIDYTLNETVDATVAATTVNGDISLTATHADPVTQTGSELEATVGDGTHQLQFETTNGDVTITD